MIIFIFFSIFCRLFIYFLYIFGSNGNGSLNEHAVADPEEVVSMVEMWVHFLSLSLYSFTFLLYFCVVHLDFHSI